MPTNLPGRLALAGLALAAACGDSTGPANPGSPPSAVASVVVSPAQAVVVQGEVDTLIAVARDAAGRTVTGRPVTWSSDPQTVATVSAAGVVTAVGQGRATITARIDGKAGTAVIDVAPPPVARVDLDAVTVTLDEGAGRVLVATPRDAQGAPIAGLGTTWSSSAPDVVTVSALGGVIALRPGQATISARIHGQTGTAVVTVTAQHPFDLLFGRWSGIAGQSPELSLVDPRDPARAVLPFLPGGLSGREATPSPDGTRAAFVVVDAWARTDIYVANRLTGAVTQLTSGPLADDQPAWSPDGQRLAFRRRAEGEAAHIWVMSADGTGPSQLTGDQSGTFSSPAWSPALPGGFRIAYGRSAGGMGHLWTMAADGTDKRQITFSTTSFDDEPSWSPDGTTIAFARSGIPDRDLWLVNAAGGSERVLIDLPLHQFSPRWSPDGKLIAFASGHETENGAHEVYTVWAAGDRRLARRTADGLHKSHPVWVSRP